MNCLIQNVLKKYNKNIWVMYNNENSDRIFCKYFTKHLASNTICIISTQKVYIILSSLDKDNVEKLKYDPKKDEIEIIAGKVIMKNLIVENIEVQSLTAEKAKIMSATIDSAMITNLSTVY